MTIRNSPSYNPETEPGLPGSFSKNDPSLGQSASSPTGPGSTAPAVDPASEAAIEAAKAEVEAEMAREEAATFKAPMIDGLDVRVEVEAFAKVAEDFQVAVDFKQMINAGLKLINPVDPAEAPAETAPASPFDQVFALLEDMAARYADESRFGTYGAWDMVGAFENLGHLANQAGAMDAAQFEAAIQALLDTLKDFPDNKNTAMVAAALLATVARVLEQSPEALAEISPELAAELSDLAGAIDVASSTLGEGGDFQSLLRSADNLENWTRRSGRELGNHETETFGGDVDFAHFDGDGSATELMQRILGDKYVEPSWMGEPAPEAPAAPAPSAPPPPRQTTALSDGVQAMVDRLLSNPRFAALIRIIEAAMQQKENAQELLNSTSGELDEKTMAIYTQANKLADQLITVATNVQKSNNDTMDTLTRNVG